MLDSFFNLGFNRACRWQVAVILFCPVLLADFGVSDSATLNLIAIDVSHAASASQGADASLVDIRSDTAALTHDVYQAQQNLEVMQGYLYRLSNSGLRSITNGIWGIFEKLNTDSQRHLSGPDTSTYHDSIYVHDVRNDDIYTRLGDIQQAINNSPVSSLCTNLPFLFMGFNNGVPTNDLKTRIRNLYISLYGVTPSSSQVDTIFNMIKANNFSQLFRDPLTHYIDISYFNAVDQNSYNTILSRWGLQPRNDTDKMYSQKYARMYNYLYGTRQLTDTVIGISNTVSYLNSQVSNAFVSVSGSLADSHVQVINEAIQRPIEYNQDTGKVENNSTVVQTVSDVADDWFGTLPSISTNIVAADTNTINNIEDNDYLASLNSVSGATPDSNPGYFSDTLEEINTKSDNFSTDFASILEESPDEFKFSFDLSGFQLGQEQRRDASPFLCEILVSDVKETTNDYVEFFCDFLDGFLCLYFAGLLWNLIYDSKAGTW